MAFGIKGIVVHCSASVFGDADEINSWHVERGWSEIGYHKVVCTGWRKPESRGGSYDFRFDGHVQQGRADDKMGAQCSAGKMNEVSLGVCLIGMPNERPEGVDCVEPGPGSIVKRAYVTAMQAKVLIDVLARMCRRHNLDPRVQFDHAGRRPWVVSQHSDHDRGKPFCASLDMKVVRAKTMERFLEL